MRMAKIKEIYRCNICGNIIEILDAGAGSLVCCGQEMELLKEKTVDEGKEKHVPVISKTAKGVLVKAGAIPHPMEEKHYIMFIEIIADSSVYRKSLKPGDAPEAEFCVSAKKVQARIYCNVHGLWKSA